ncbi:hypothetical protein D3C87_482780 [compost metagenome]
MAQMLVKDLVEILLKVDQNLPVHKHHGGGEFKPIDIDYAGHWVGYGELMQSKNDPSYFASTKDSIWKKVRKQFRAPFKAVVFW